MNGSTGPARAGGLQWVGLAVLALPTLLNALDINVLFLALPQLTRDLGASSTEQLWIIDIDGFLLAGFVITMGTLGDRIGRRKLLFIGGTIFALVSVVGAYSVNPGMLIGTRALLGIAGATLMPSTLALITNMFRDDRQRSTAISIWATCQFGGAALGPVFGGVLLDHFWWGSVFLLAVPVAAVLLGLGPFVLPEFRSDDAGSLDLLSVGMSLLGVLPLIYGIKGIATGDQHVGVGIVAIVVGLVFLMLFVRRQLHLERPLLDLSLFKLSRVSVVLVSLVGAGIVMAGVAMQITQYLQTVLGYSPLAAAMWFAPMGLAVAVGTTLTPTLTKHVSQKGAISAGLVLAAIGSALILLIPAQGPPVMTVVAIVVLALGTGPLFALGIGYIVGSVPPGRAGAAAALSETGNYLGSALGLALLGALGAAVYRSGMSEVAPASAAGPEALARETVSGATRAAAGLPIAQARILMESAFDSFTSGLHTVGAAGAVIFLLLAVATSRINTAPPATDDTPVDVVDHESGVVPS